MGGMFMLTNLRDMKLLMQMEGMEKEKEKICSMMWGLWRRRNQKIFEGKEIQPKEAVNKALPLLHDFQYLQQTSPSLGLKNRQWLPPPQGVLKLNLDGAIFVETGKTSVECVLHDEKWDILMVATSPEQLLHTPFDIEFLAMFRGIQLCLNMGIGKLLVESDCLLAVKALMDGEEYHAQPGTQIKEIVALKDRFQDYRFEYASRDGNTVAHKLALFAWQVQSLSMWWETIPDFTQTATWVDKACNPL